MLDNNPAATSIVADGVSLYQLRKDGSIWKYVTPVLSGWQVLDSNPATVAITAGGGYLYQRHNDGTLWMYLADPTPR